MFNFKVMVPSATAGRCFSLIRSGQCSAALSGPQHYRYTSHLNCRPTKAQRNKPEGGDPGECGQNFFVHYVHTLYHYPTPTPPKERIPDPPPEVWESCSTCGVLKSWPTQTVLHWSLGLIYWINPQVQQNNLGILQNWQFTYTNRCMYVYLFVIA